jgi:hypothetical protein
MRKLRIPAALAASSLVAAASMMALAPSAQADLVTRCVGEGGDVTVPGDLVVPAGQSCWLDGTTVKGTVTVRKNADLVVYSGKLDGKVRAVKNAYVDTTDTSLGDNLVTNNAYGSYLDDSQVAGAVNARNSGTDNGGFVYAVDSQLNKRLHAKVPGEVVLDGSHVMGPVVGDGTRYTDVSNSTLDRRLSVTDNPKGGTFCDSEVYGNASYTGNTYALQIGADGPITACDGVSFFGGSLDVSDNNGTIRVSDTIIRNDLSGTGNDPAPQGENNRVRGTVSGQFKDLKPPSDNNKMPARTMAKHTVTHRDATVKHQASSRRAHAKTQAHTAGKANL